MDILPEVLKISNNHPSSFNIQLVDNNNEPLAEPILSYTICGGTSPNSVIVISSDGSAGGHIEYNSERMYDDRIYLDDLDQDPPVDAKTILEIFDRVHDRYRCSISDLL